VVSTILLISSFVNRYSGKNAPTPVIAALSIAIDSIISKKSSLDINIIFYRREDKPKTKENQGIDIWRMQEDNKY
jgi:hypothetical protein